MTAPTTSRDVAPETRAPGLRAWWRWLAVVGYGVAIFAASSMSHVSLPGRFSDKQVHALVFAGLSALIVWALSGGSLRRVTFLMVIIATGVCLVYGVADEVHQLFVPYRQFDVHDMVADTTGALLAAIAMWACGILLRGGPDQDGV